jgi:hypothetical protein
MSTLPNKPTKAQMTHAIRDGVIVVGGGIQQVGSSIYFLGKRQSNRPELFPIFNNSGQDLDRSNIIGIDSPAADPTVNLARFRNQIAFVGSLPVAPTHYSSWGVIWAPVKNGAWGLVQLTGTAAVQVDITDTTHYNAGITSGDPTHLTSGQIAVARMVPPSSSTGLVWKYVTLNNTFRTTTKECT